MTDYDIVVVGCGPGGAVAGMTAASRGAKVLILDRKKEVGLPVVCGELTSHGTYSEFGLDPLGPWAARVMNSARIIFPNGKKFDFMGIKLAMVNRDKLEQHLARKAMEEGAKIRMGEMVKDLTPRGVLLRGGEEIDARIIVAADGVKSTIGKKLGMVSTPQPYDMGRAVKYIVTSEGVDGRMGKIYPGEMGLKGYAWIFPKSKNMANVGLGSLGPNIGNMKPLLDRFIHKHFPDAIKEKYTAGALPLSLPPRRTVQDNVILVGDAGSMVNSIGGAGIRNAMVAGRLAGTLAGECVVNKLPLGHLKKYERQWRRKIYLRLRVNHMIKKVIWENEIPFKMLPSILAPLSLMSAKLPHLLPYLQDKQHN